MPRTLDRREVLGARVRAQQLDRERGPLEGTAVLDLGVQDSGPDGARWALALRGVDRAEVPDGALALAWTVRGAPHAYLRGDLPAVAAAVAPWSDADAGRRIYDASKPLAAAGITNLAALDVVAEALREVVTGPVPKGDASGRVTALLDPPYVRWCRPCGAEHVWEMPFRLAALRAGLELEEGTSPPVLRPLAGHAPLAEVPPRQDLVRGYLRLLGPATPGHVAGYLDAPVAEVRARWPEDAVEVEVEGQKRWALPPLLDRRDGGSPEGVRLLGPFDLLLQARDRDLLVPDPMRAKALWPVLGRPGAVLADGDLAGLWRPRQTGGRLRVRVEPWLPLTPALRARVEEQAERLAAHRGARLAGVDVSD